MHNFYNQNLNCNCNSGSNTQPPVIPAPVTIPPTTLPQVTLSPPWYTFANQIKYTYGCSSMVKVNNLLAVDNDDYVLVINVCNDEVAKALRQVLPMTKLFGNVKVSIIIFNSTGQQVYMNKIAYTPETLAKVICTALRCNPLFGGCVLTAGKLPPIGTVGAVAVIIDRAVVQFYNDDISDLCSNYNEVASVVFTEVSNLMYPDNLLISFTTFDSKCALQKDIFC